MNRPDIARTDLSDLPREDLRFLVENMPQAGRSYEELAAAVQELPTTLESMLSSEYVYRLIREHEGLLLDVSPFLLFGVLLRRTLDRPRSGLERRVINYLANLLTLFMHSERVLRVEPDDPQPRHYVVELLQEAEESDPQRAFLTYAHLGNYALWLTGLQMQWLEYRYRYGRRPVDPDYYSDFGRTSFDRAARHQMAERFGLDDVFLRLALMFEYYREGLNRLHAEYLSGDG